MVSDPPVESMLFQVHDTTSVSVDAFARKQSQQESFQKINVRRLLMECIEIRRGFDGFCYRTNETAVTTVTAADAPSTFASC